MAAYRRRDPNSVIFALITVSAKEKIAITIPFKYRGFQHLFEKAKGKKALPKY
jgi:hypothetical protein